MPWRRLQPGILALIVVACSGGEHEEAKAPQPSERVSTAKPPPAPTRSWAHPEIKAELLLDLEQKRSPADGGGRGWLEHPEEGRERSVRASGRARFPLVYEAGRLGIAEGGALFLQVSPFWGWDTPQSEVAEAPGYTVVSTDAEGVTLAPRTLGPQLLGIEIRGRALREGERVRIDYGAGPAGAKADRFAESSSRFWIAVDGDGDGVRKIIEGSPGVNVVAGGPALLRLTVPGTARPGEKVPLTIAVLDAVGNMGAPFAGEVRLSLEGDDGGLELPATIPFALEDRGRRTVDITAKGEGLFRVRGAAYQQGEAPEEEHTPALEAESNPLLVDAQQQATLLWGDLHGHTQLSDGSATPAEYFTYGRDVAGLDFLAITDHDHWGLEALDRYPELWSEMRRQVELFDEPGRFVPLLGFEWTNWVEGHRHVVWFEDEDEAEVVSSLDPATDTPPELWQALRGKPVLTFAHHSAGGPVPIDWSIPPDPELEPNTEISSVHGSSEAPDSPTPIYNPKPGNYVRDALDLGYVLGFVGGGDSHDGHPGLAEIAGGKSGITGLWTTDEEPRTATAIRQALKARHAYATNGPRMYVQASLDGHRMGSALAGASRDAKPQRLAWSIAGTAPIERIDVVRRGAPVLSIPGDGRRAWSGETEVPPLAGGEYLYLRIVQDDGGAAWTSPFFASPVAAPTKPPADGAAG